MNLHDLSNIPLKSLPTEVLLSLRDGIRKELGRRGQAGEDVERSQGHAGLYRRTKLKPGEADAKIFKRRLHELDALMAEDWGHLFPVGCEERRFYVYAHVDPRKTGVRVNGQFALSLPGRPFYIGKGVGRRAWDLSRNEGHGMAWSCVSSASWVLPTARLSRLLGMPSRSAKPLRLSRS